MEGCFQSTGKSGCWRLDQRFGQVPAVTNTKRSGAVESGWTGTDRRYGGGEGYPPRFSSVGVGSVCVSAHLHCAATRTRGRSPLRPLIACAPHRRHSAAPPPPLLSKQHRVLVPSIFAPSILAVHFSIGAPVCCVCCLMPGF